MKIGFDTSLCLTSTVKGTTIDVLTDVSTWLGHPPDFCIRPTGVGGKAQATPLTLQEIIDVATGNLPLAGYFNDSLLNGVNPPVATANLGVSEALSARSQITALGFPKSCPIIMDFENYLAVNAAYFQGVKSEEPSAVVYGNSTTCSIADGVGLATWLSSWQAQEDYANAQKLTLPKGQVLWQFSGNAFNGVCDLDAATDALVASFYLPLPAGASSTASVQGLLQNAQQLLTQALGYLAN